jgi:SAM-dependent methyltransferase
MSYTTAFYQSQMTGSRQSADRIAAHITELLHPQSVVDIGCGVGTWLAAFRHHGASRIEGYDGDYVDRTLLQIPADSFHSVDLDKALRAPFAWLPNRFDLAVSLEVAEHLAPELAESLVDRLSQFAPAVLFSAAIPRQGGTGHVNEQWQDYWATLFDRRGYRSVDCVRPVVWDDVTVEPWYAQNALLYVSSEVEVDVVVSTSLPLRVVHPQVFLKQLEEPRPLDRLIRKANVSARRMLRVGSNRRRMR